MHSILEMAKLQDEERQIAIDEKIYLTTGRNVAYDEYATDPLVPIGGEHILTEKISEAQKRKIERMRIKQQEIINQRKAKIDQKVNCHKMESKNPINLIEAN